MLATFGDNNGHTAMNSTEAQTYADRGWTRWDEVVEAIVWRCSIAAEVWRA